MIRSIHRVGVAFDEWRPAVQSTHGATAGALLCASNPVFTVRQGVATRQGVAKALPSRPRRRAGTDGLVDKCVSEGVSEHRRAG